MKRDYIGSLFCGMSKPPVMMVRIEWDDEREFRKSLQQTKLKILKWLIPTMILSFMLGYQYEHDPRVIKLQHENESKQQLINKQQDYIRNVVVPVKKIMNRNKCHNQEIYSGIMKTKYPVYTAKIIEIESEFYQYAVSSCGARGLMQIAPCHGRFSTFDIQKNIEFGARYFEWGLQRTGTIEGAIICYNAGPAAVGRYLPVETAQYIRKFKRGMEI
jgi:hypothetical protein